MEAKLDIIDCEVITNIIRTAVGDVEDLSCSDRELVVRKVSSKES